MAATQFAPAEVQQLTKVADLTVGRRITIVKASTGIIGTYVVTKEPYWRRTVKGSARLTQFVNLRDERGMEWKCETSLFSLGRPTRARGAHTDSPLMSYNKLYGNVNRFYVYDEVLPDVTVSAPPAISWFEIGEPITRSHFDYRETA